MRTVEAVEAVRSVSSWVLSCGVEAECIVGGSTARDEHTPESDIDAYVLTSWRGGLRILRSADQFRILFSKKHTSLTVLPYAVVRMGLYYFEGVDTLGIWKKGQFVPKVQSRTALRTAYGALAAEALHKDNNSWYRMRKAWLYGIPAYAIANSMILPDKKAVFSSQYAWQVVWPQICKEHPIFSSLESIETMCGDLSVHRMVLLQFLTYVSKEVCNLSYPWQLRLIDAVSAFRSHNYTRMWIEDEYKWYTQFSKAILEKDIMALDYFSHRFVPCITV